MLANIPDWVEIVVGVLLTQVPRLRIWQKARPRKRQRERRLHVKLGHFEWKSTRRDDDRT